MVIYGPFLSFFINPFLLSRHLIFTSSQITLSRAECVWVIVLLRARTLVSVLIRYEAFVWRMVDWGAGQVCSACVRLAKLGFGVQVGVCACLEHRSLSPAINHAEPPSVITHTQSRDVWAVSESVAPWHTHFTQKHGQAHTHGVEQGRSTRGLAVCESPQVTSRLSRTISFYYSSSW